MVCFVEIQKGAHQFIRGQLGGNHHEHTTPFPSQSIRRVYLDELSFDPHAILRIPERAIASIRLQTNCGRFGQTVG